MKNHYITASLFDKGIVFVTFVFLIASIALGIDVYKKCDEAKKSKTYQNLNMALGHFLTMSITAGVISLIIMKSPRAIHLLGAMFSILGIITSGMTLGMTKKCKDTAVDERTGQDRERFAGVAIGLMVLFFMIHMFMLRGVYGTPKPVMAPAAPKPTKN